MAKTNEELAKKLVQRDGKKLSRVDTVREMMERLRPQFEAVLPRHVTPQRLVVIALNVMRRTPKLYDCTNASLCGAIMEGAQLGLDFAVPNECFLIPYDRYQGGKLVATEAQFQLGYKGLMKLAKRAYASLGQPIAVLDAQPVYSADYYFRERGTEGKLIHRPPRFADRGTLEGFYAYCRLADGGEDWIEMNVAEMEAHRDRFSKSHAQAVRGKHLERSAWHTDFVAMGQKTIMRQLCWRVLDLAVSVVHLGPQGHVQTSNLLERDIAVEAQDEESTLDIDPATGEMNRPIPKAPGFDPAMSAKADLADYLWDMALPGAGAVAETRRGQILAAVYQIVSVENPSMLLEGRQLRELEQGIPVVEHLTALCQQGTMPAHLDTEESIQQWLRSQAAMFRQRQAVMTEASAQTPAEDRP